MSTRSADAGAQAGGGGGSRSRSRSPGYGTVARNSSSVSLNHSGRSRLGMWATSGRSIRRAPGIRGDEAPPSPASTACRGRRSSRGSARAPRPGARWPADPARSCRRTASPARRSRTSSGAPPRAPLPAPAPRAGRGRRPTSPRRAPPSPPSPWPRRAPPRARRRQALRASPRPRSRSGHRRPRRGPTRDPGYSRAVSMAIEPAREHPTSTARSRPAASITATRSARLEKRVSTTSARPNPRRS